MRIIDAKKIKSRHKTGSASVWAITLRSDSNGLDMIRHATAESNREGIRIAAGQPVRACSYRSRSQRYPSSTGASATIKRLTWLDGNEGDNLPALVLKSFHTQVATQSGKREQAITMEELQEEAALLFAQGYQAYAGMRQSVHTSRPRPFAIQEDIAECDMVERLDGIHQMPSISGDDGLRALIEAFLSQLAFITLFHQTQRRPHYDLKLDNTMPRLKKTSNFFERIAIIDLVDSMGGRGSCTFNYLTKKDRRLSQRAFVDFKAGDQNSLTKICHVDFHQLALTTALVVDQIEYDQPGAHFSVIFSEDDDSAHRFSVRKAARRTFLGQLMRGFMAFNAGDSVEGVIRQAFDRSSREQIEPREYWLRVYSRELEACQRRYRAYKTPAELAMLGGGAARETDRVTPEDVVPGDGGASHEAIAASLRPAARKVRERRKSVPKSSPAVDLGCCSLFGKRAVPTTQQRDVVLAAQAFIVQRY